MKALQLVQLLVSILALSVLAFGEASFATPRACDLKSILESSVPEAKDVMVLSAGVLKWNTKYCGDVVLRIHASKHDVHYEKFVAKFIERAPNIPSAPLETGILSLPATAVVRAQLYGARNLERWRDRRDEFDAVIFSNGPLTVSITPFHPYPSGSVYLTDVFAREARIELYEARSWGHVNRLGKQDEYNSHVAHLEKLWTDVSPMQREQIKLLLTSIFPDLENVELDSLPAAYADQWQHVETSDRTDIEDRLRGLIAGDLFSSLPVELRAGLANYVGVFNVAGLSDTHPGNWLAETGPDGHVLVRPIDFAHRFERFDDGTSLDVDFMQTPLLGRPFTRDPGLSHAALRHIDPTLRQFFATLSEETIRSIALAVEFPITDREIAGMMGRARALSMRAREARECSSDLGERRSVQF